MIKLTAARQTKVDAMRTAARWLAIRLRQHPEYAGYGAPEMMLDCGRQDSVSPYIEARVEVDAQFAKYGREIFQVPRENDDGDYDWPTLVGGAVLKRMAVAAAKRAGLTLGRTVCVTVNPSEKGFVAVGYVMRWVARRPAGRSNPR